MFFYFKRRWLRLFLGKSSFWLKSIAILIGIFFRNSFCGLSSHALFRFLLFFVGEFKLLAIWVRLAKFLLDILVNLETITFIKYLVVIMCLFLVVSRNVFVIYLFSPSYETRRLLLWNLFRWLLVMMALVNINFISIFSCPVILSVYSHINTIIFF